MPLEAPLPPSAQQKLQHLREQLDEALHGLVADMLAQASVERDAALDAARTAAEQEKEAAVETVRQQCEAAIAQRVAEAATPAEEPSLAERLAAALSEAEAARALVAETIAERDQARQALAESNTARDEAVAAVGALNAERNQAMQALAESNAERDKAAQALADATTEAAERLAVATAAAAAAKAEAAETIEAARVAADRQIEDARVAAAHEAASERTLSEQALVEARKEAEARLAESKTEAASRLAEIQVEADRKVAAASAEAADRIAEARADADRRLTEARAHAEGEARAAAAADLQQARIGERECDLACVERVVDAMRALDVASSLSATLDALADHLAAHVARVAILVIRDRELRIWTTAGFGEEILKAPSISVRLDGETVVARAALTGERVTTANGTGGKPLEPLTFASLPPDRIGLAVPLRVGGRPVAVVYADQGPSGERTVPSAWPEVVEILGRHAAACLELLTLTAAYALHARRPDNVQAAAPAGSSIASARAAALDGEIPANGESDTDVAPGAGEQSQAAEEDASAIRYARLLISEIKLYHEDAVTEGREEANLLARLGPEISRARRLYEERVPAEVRNRADHFGQELVRTLANGDPRLLGQNT